MKQSIKKTNQSAKILENYAKCKIQDLFAKLFANSTQTTIFYIQDLFQLVFITSIKPQITQEHIKSHQRSNCLVFLSF